MTHLLLLAASDAVGSGDPSPTGGFTPFIDPLPIWSHDWTWSLLLFPLCLAVAIVYKAIKCRTLDRLPREAAVLFVTIVLWLAAAAAVLAGIVKMVS